jgi:hypothetical protein
MGGILIRVRFRFGSKRAARARGVRNRADPGQQAGLTGLDLQTQILGVDAALGETAGDDQRPGCPVRTNMLRNSWSSPKPQIGPTRAATSSPNNPLT